MKARDPFDFWFAVNNTEVVLMPSRQLETFGTTVLDYHLISELMDSTTQVRIREGRMQAGQPQIVTPEAYSQLLMEGFGDQAERYVQWLREHEQDVQILQYGYHLKQESFSEHVVTDTIEAVTTRVTAQVRESSNPLSAVVRGVDDPWDVCLVKLFWEVIRQSVAGNVRQMRKRRLFDKVGGVPRVVRNEIEDAFTAAARDRALIPALSDLLQRHRVFEEYEDRFFSLVRSSGGAAAAG